VLLVSLERLSEGELPGASKGCDHEIESHARKDGDDKADYYY
jgi:hypothetical protein